MRAQRPAGRARVWKGRARSSDKNRRSINTPATSVTTPPLAVRVKKSSLICGPAARVRRRAAAAGRRARTRLWVQVQLFQAGKGRWRPGLGHPVRRQPRPPRGQPRRLHGAQERRLEDASFPGGPLPRKQSSKLAWQGAARGRSTRLHTADRPSPVSVSGAARDRRSSSDGASSPPGRCQLKRLWCRAAASRRRQRRPARQRRAAGSPLQPGARVRACAAQRAPRRPLACHRAHARTTAALTPLRRHRRCHR